MRGLPRWAVGTLGVLAVAAVPQLTQAMPPTPAAEHALIAGYNGTGEKLYALFARDPGNVVFSPYSIGSAMTMALMGARGDNEREMAAALGLVGSRDQLAAANAAVLSALNDAGKDTLKLRIANALMVTGNGSAVGADYAALLSQNFAAELFRNASLATVNGWVKERTEGKIPSIVDRLDPSTALVLINAVYFKAPWAVPFAVRATRDEPFHLQNGTADVPTMHLRSDFAYAERVGYRAIALPYAGDRLAMIVALPDGDLAATERKLDGAEMSALVEALQSAPQPVELSLPRFKTTFQASLVSAFQSLGMHRAFDSEAADFSGMTGRPPAELPLCIDDVVHKAVIEVAEQGTEAAAATGVPMATRAMRPQQVQTFKVDRPFLFAIIDQPTGAILFQGRIVDPR